MPNKSKYFSTKKYMYFYLGKNTDALFAYTFGRFCRFVWRQLELCVFQCVSFGWRTFYFIKKPRCNVLKFGMRKPSLKKSFKARTTGKLKRKVKKSVNPLYGKKGVGFVKNPKKSVKNKIYHKTTFGWKKLFK